jgi:hypothetical protein
VAGWPAAGEAGRGFFAMVGLSVGK